MADDFGFFTIKIPNLSSLDESLLRYRAIAMGLFEVF